MVLGSPVTGRLTTFSFKSLQVLSLITMHASIFATLIFKLKRSRTHWEKTQQRPVLLSVEGQVLEHWVWA